MLTASGARFGFRATIPHVLGVVLGVGITAGLTGFGIGAFIAEWPQIGFSLKILAATWILWMGYKLWISTGTAAPETPARPFTFFQAVLFQWVNPKVWAVALAASSAYNAGLSPTGEALRLASTFSGLNLFVCLFWSFSGALLALLLTRPAIWKIFIRIMAVALAGSAMLVFL
jgi:threonine/homoserine/homoserine lactone efflux protein